MKQNLALTHKSDRIEAGEVKDFYQSKFDFYKEFTKWLVIIASLSSTSYFYSDCQIFGRFATETFVARMAIVPILIVYLILQHNIGGYKRQCVMSYLMLNAIVCCTCIACHYLPDLSHVNEGLLIMQCMFFAAGFSAPFYYNLLGYGIYYAQVFIAANVNGYQDLDYILSLGVPLTVGIILAQFFLQKLYVSHFKMECHLKESSVRDNLTGVYNRNYISEFISPNKKNIFKNESSVMIFDIDFFKNVNDTLGHMEGDKILRELAENVGKKIRSTDYLIRWGGEEFVVLMPDTKLDEAMHLAEAIRINIEESKNFDVPITISAGVARYRDFDLEASVNAADQYLYEAKKTGRNKVLGEKK